MSDDDWRRRRAEELYDGAPIPRSSYVIPTSPPPVAPPPPAMAPAAVSPPVAPPVAPPPVAPPRAVVTELPGDDRLPPLPAYRAPPQRQAAAPRASAWLAGAVAAGVAAVLGWVGHDLVAPAPAPRLSTSIAPADMSVAPATPSGSAGPVAAGGVSVRTAPTAAGEIDAAALDGDAPAATRIAGDAPAAPHIAPVPARTPPIAVSRRAARVPADPAVAPVAVKRPAPLPRRAAVDTAPPRARGNRDDRPIATTANGPSFNCRRATASVNRMICANPDLAALDRTLAATYRRADRSLPPGAADQLHDDETDFLNRRQNCRTPDCVARLYRNRIDEIEGAR